MISKKIRNNGKIFFVCFFISFLIWFSIKQAEINYVVSSYTVIPVNIPTGKILLNSIDTVLKLKLHTKKNRLFHFVLANPKHIYIDLKGIPLIRQNEKSIVSLNNKEIIECITNQLNDEYEIISIFPSKLQYTLSDEYYKKVPVITDFTVYPARQFKMTKNIFYNFDSITLRGEKSIIDTIRFVKTEKKIIANISKSNIYTLKLINPIKNNLLFLDKQEITANVKVEEFTERKIIIPVAVGNCNKNYQLKIFPDDVTIIFQVPVSKFSSVDPNMFQAIVNCPNSADSKTLPIQIIHKPDFINLTKIYPEKTEYILIKR